jgi:CheY-like chemotaxis protein
MPDSEYRIFIAEDNDADVYLIDEALRRHGLPYRLEVSDNGEDMLMAVARIEQDISQPCPDLFLVDLNLPRRPGYDVLAQIREGQRCGQVPVIIITSSNSPQDRARAKELGASFYFRKPPDLERFMAIGGIVRQFLESKGGVVPQPAI